MQGGSLAAWCSSVASQGHVPRLDELEALQGSPNFVPELVAVLQDQRSPEVQLLATMCLKNSVKARWRLKLSCEDKQLIRRSLLVLIGQPASPQVATQLAVTVGQVARFDWPEQWPELLPALTASLSDAVADSEQRCLLVLHHVVKALMSKTLPRHRQQFKAVSCELLPFIVERLLPRLQDIVGGADPSATPATSVACSALAVKCCGHLLTRGLCSLGAGGGDSAGQQLLLAAIACLPSLLARDDTEALANALGRLLLRCQSHLHKEFAGLLQPALRLAVAVAFESPAELCGRDRKVVIHALNLLKQCTIAYASPCNDASAALLEASDTLQQLLSEAVVESTVWGLLRRYLTSSQEELEESVRSPEDVVFAQQPEQAHELSSRHAAEAVLQALLKELPQRTLAAVERVVRTQLSAQLGPSEQEGVLALLAACPYDLAKCVRFSELCDQCVLPLFSADSADSVWQLVLQRRALMLLDAWADVPDALPAQLYSSACGLATQLLAPGRHPLLRLQAARLVHALLTSLSLDASAFQPHAAACFQGLADLLANAQSPEAQVQLLSVVAGLLKYSVADLRPCLPALVQHLPRVWHSASGHQARLAVLAVLCELAKLGHCERLAELALPLAHACLTGADDLYWPSGLQLALYLLCNMHAYPSVGCFAETLACLHERVAQRAHMEPDEKRLLQVCLYLDCEQYLRGHGGQLAEACRQCLLSDSLGRKLQPLPLANDALKVSPQAALRLLAPLLQPVAARLLESPDVLWANRLAFWKLLSRATVADSRLVLSSIASQQLQAALAGWIGACNRVAKLRDCKLIGLGLLLFAFALYAAGPSPLDAAFPDVVEAVIGVVVHCHDASQSSFSEMRPQLRLLGQDVVCQEAGRVTDESPEDQSCHEVRKKLVNAADCVRQLSMLEYFRQEVRTLLGAVQPARAQALLDSLDSVTKAQLLELGACGQ